MPQFNGKQEGVKAMQAKPASAEAPNLRCPRNGKTNELLTGPAPGRTPLSSLATERLEQAHGKAMKVAFVSPDTGQQGGGASFFKARRRDAHALAGKPVRAYLLNVSK